MCAITNEQLQGFSCRDVMEVRIVVHEIVNEEVSVQDNDFSLLTVDEPGWCWLVHTCYVFYKMKSSGTEEQCNGLMRSIAFGYLGGLARRTWRCPCLTTPTAGR